MARPQQPAQVASDGDIIEALRSTTSKAAAARKLGINLRTMQRRIPLLAKRGYAPEYDMVHPVPDGFLTKGVSTYFNDEGKPTGQWVKSDIDRARWEQLAREAVAALSADIKRAKPVRPPKDVLADLASCYVVTDYHLGMLSWAEETGADWDTDIAEDMMVAWFAEAIAQAPASAVGIFAQLGDLLHWDGLDAVTPASKHLLDADTRFPKLVRTVIRVIRRVIAMLLAKHGHVHVIMAEGNHDPASSIHTREWLSALYEDEPRVTVDLRSDTYYCYEHGDTSLFFHHGHKRKPANIDDVFAAKFREVWGRTKFSYAHMGHMHHIDAKETNLMVVEQHRTLAAPDAYAARGGWMSGRDAKVITYHRHRGEVGRVVVSSAMLEAA